KPVAITNCLNFGNPYKPEVYWVFKEAVAGMGDACRTFETPVTGGNVSFYNENPDGAVFPTPTIGMLGIVEDILRDVTTTNFKNEGDAVYLLSPAGWQHREDIGGSEYLARIHGLTAGDAPHLDLEEEAAVQRKMLELIRSGQVSSAHDVSDGGLAVTLAESVIYSDGFGADVDVASAALRLDSVLFGEAQSRIVFTSPDQNMAGTTDGVEIARIGTVSRGALRIRHNGHEVINVAPSALREPYDNALPAFMER
ncbi:MAG TPA: AIR synthase-related protein, partial [Rhodothermales bacterium]|nr:AIR synthase-related protein [Rhodothermales bacterium]